MRKQENGNESMSKMKGAEMSLTGTLKKIEGEKKDLEAMAAANAEQIAALTQAHEIATQALTAMQAEHEQKLVSITEAHAEALAAMEARAVAAETELEASRADMAEVTAKLAVADGLIALSPELGDAASSGQAPVADSSIGQGEEPSLVRQYQAISDPRQRTAFYRANEKELMLELHSRADN